MKGPGQLLISCCALFFLSDVKAASLSAEQIERAVFLHMTLSPDYEKSRLGVRILGQQFPNEDSLCDYVAERLLKEPIAPRGVAVDAISWYVNTLRDSCSTRYRDTLTLARQRYTDEKIIKYLDLALATPVTASVEQYKEGGVDLLSRQMELEQQLIELKRTGGSNLSGVVLGMPFGEVLQRAGVPQDLSSLTLRIARYGRADVLVAHYAGSGMLMFRRDPTGGKWLLADTFDEIYPVSETYKGPQFAVAQSLACLHGESFREYVKTHGRAIRQDVGLTWALTNRLSKTPFPADRYEEDGMLVGLKLIVTSRHPEKLDMLKQIGAAPGDKVPEAARAYVTKLEGRTATPAASSP